MLDAQTKICRELALRFDQLESTLARSLNEAMRPIETRIKEHLSHAVFGRESAFGVSGSPAQLQYAGAV
jgi:hypothetical protein